MTTWCGHLGQEASAAEVESQGSASAGELPLESVYIPDGVPRYGYAAAVKMERFARLLLGWMNDNPRSLRLLLGGIFAIVLAIHLAAPAHAGFVLDSIQNQFQSATTGWMTASLGLAQRIFFAVAVCMLCYNIVAYYVAFESLRGLGGVIFRSLLNLGVPLVVLTAAAPALSAIINLATQLGGQIGVSTAVTTPDEVATTGTQIGWSLLAASFKILANSHFQFDIGNIGNSLGFDIIQGVVDILFIVLAAFLCITMVFSFVFIAIELLVAYMQAYFSLPLGAWSLGFMASGPTSGIAAGYWAGVIQTLVRFLAILAAVTIAEAIGRSWATSINTLVGQWNGYTGNPNNPVDLGALKVVLSMALGALGLLYVVKQIPALAMAALSGAPALSGGAFIRSAGGNLATAATPLMMAGGAAVGGAKGVVAGGRAAGAGGAAAGGIQGAAQGGARGAQTARNWRNMFR